MPLTDFLLIYLNYTYVLYLLLGYSLFFTTVYYEPFLIITSWQSQNIKEYSLI